jgi:hypothetical protein
MPTTKDLAVGDRAPLFTLSDQDGKKVSLTDFKGKKNVVLIFYPGDMTPGCTMQLCAIRDDWSKFGAKDAVVYGVNHADAGSHRHGQEGQHRIRRDQEVLQGQRHPTERVRRRLGRNDPVRTPRHAEERGYPQGNP